MTAAYVSIREDVLKTLQDNLDEIRTRFGIDTIGIFGSVARGEDTKNSDIDILYRFQPDKIDYYALLDLHDYLQELFGRKIDLIPIDNMRHSFKKYVMSDMVLATADLGVA